jgi:probable F420-dependent oxidoreductase
MDWGIHLPHMGRQASGEALVSFAQRAEALGVHSGWVSDHIAFPRDIESRYPYSADGSFPAAPNMPWLDPIGTMFFVAGCTKTLKLGATVLILGYRPPVQTAKAIASLDVVSGGRLILGVGVGWMREEFEVLGMPYDHRGRRADEQLEVFRTLFSEEHPSHTGEYYSFPEVGFEPKPVNGRVPIWVGGNTEAAYRRTAHYGDAFHAAFEPVDAVRAGWARVQELAEGEGRDANVSQSVRSSSIRRRCRRRSRRRLIEQMLDTIGGWREIGVSHVLPTRWHRVNRWCAAAMERFMTTDVAPLVKVDAAAGRGWRSKNSFLSLWSENSFLSIGSKGSMLSIGSVGSFLSIGSIGSVASVFSIASAGSALSIMSALSRRSVMSARSRRGVMRAQR